ncbi:hypothetical protein NPIL_661991 [Nephila pilipes]|uniref:Uncharacterized protein n=1 Tax=Nephila pilipes TaxID=299642 RepID=A0A8X6TVC3_NEPPI|nr:hypothetical protein NPIL_661991 [Nephila pilipes]
MINFSSTILPLRVFLPRRTNQTLCSIRNFNIGECNHQTGKLSTDSRHCGSPVRLHAPAGLQQLSVIEGRGIDLFLATSISDEPPALRPTSLVWFVAES